MLFVKMTLVTISRLRVNTNPQVSSQSFTFEQSVMQVCRTFLPAQISSYFSSIMNTCTNPSYIFKLCALVHFSIIYIAQIHSHTFLQSFTLVQFRRTFLQLPIHAQIKQICFQLHKSIICFSNYLQWNESIIHFSNHLHKLHSILHVFQLSTLLAQIHRAFPKYLHLHKSSIHFSNSFTLGELSHIFFQFQLSTHE